MGDIDKTKEQLVGELEDMRQRVARLEVADTERKQAEEDRKKAQTYLQVWSSKNP